MGILNIRSSIADNYFWVYFQFVATKYWKFTLKCV